MSATTTLETVWTAMGDSATVTNPEAPNVRYVVWQDDDAECPADYWETAQAIQYAGASARTPDDATGALGAFLRHYAETGDDDAALRFARRYVRAFQTGEAIDTRTMTGYSQSHWADVVIVAQGDAADYLDSLADEYAQWFRGDVYVVMAKYATVCDRGETHWDTVTDQGIDSIPLGGIYADDAESAARYYLEDRN